MAVLDQPAVWCGLCSARRLTHKADRRREAAGPRYRTPTAAPPSAAAATVVGRALRAGGKLRDCHSVSSATRRMGYGRSSAADGRRSARVTRDELMRRRRRRRRRGRCCRPSAPLRCTMRRPTRSCSVTRSSSKAAGTSRHWMTSSRSSASAHTTSPPSRRPPGPCAPFRREARATTFARCPPRCSALATARYGGLELLSAVWAKAEAKAAAELDEGDAVAAAAAASASPTHRRRRRREEAAAEEVTSRRWRRSRSAGCCAARCLRGCGSCGRRADGSVAHRAEPRAAPPRFY